jgi:hypothetical protein
MFSHLIIRMKIIIHLSYNANYLFKAYIPPINGRLLNRQYSNAFILTAVSLLCHFYATILSTSFLTKNEGVCTRTLKPRNRDFLSSYIRLKLCKWGFLLRCEFSTNPYCTCCRHYFKAASGWKYVSAKVE